MEELNARALCTLDDVKQYLNLTEEVDQDELLIRLINAASEAIYHITGREFVPLSDEPSTRVFDAYDTYANGVLYVGDFTDITAITIYNQADEVVEAMDMDDVTFLPRNKQPWEPYNALRLRNQTVYWTNYISMVGQWGFPSIPDEIRQAAVVTVSVWHARDIADFGATFSIEQDRVELPRAIPPHVQDTISRYQHIPVA